MSWSVNKLSIELGMDRRTITKRLSEIEPESVDGKAKLYRLADACQAIFNPGRQGGSLDEERTRLTKAQADKTELEVETLRGDLIPADIVLATWQAMVGAMRAKLLSLPTKAAHAALNAIELHEVEEIIQTQVYEALNELSSDGMPEEVKHRRDSHQDTGSGDPTTQTDSKPVGRQQKATKRGKRSGTGGVAH